jgi:hypothetical protein
MGRLPLTIPRAVLVAIAVTWLVPSYTVAFASVARVEPAVSEASASEDVLTDVDGASALAIVLAYRSASGEATLWIRICPAITDCSDYFHQLTDDEYILQPTTSIAYINADVEGLGDVSLRNFSNDVVGKGQICSSEGTRTVLAIEGLQPSIYPAGDAFGGVIGPWTVAGGGGGCGMNARDVTLTLVEI